MRTVHVQSSFAAGAVTGGWTRKPETSLYSSALGGAVNMLFRADSSAYRRPSTRFVTQSQAAGAVFGVSTPDGGEWVIELFHDGSTTKARFYTQQSILLHGETVFEVAGLPYTAAELANVATVQVTDKVYLLHSNYTPRLLTYTVSSATRWALSTPTFTGEMAGKKPSIGVVYGQRLVFSGFSDKYGRVLFSRTPDANGVLRLTDFTTGTDADHALDFTTARGEVIYWLLERDSGVLMGTQSGMYLLTSQDVTAPLSGLNATVKKQNSLSMGKIQPQEIDQSFFAVDNSLRKFVLAQYSFELSGIQTEPLDGRGQDFFDKQITHMAFSQNEGLLWILTENRLLSMSFFKQTEVLAFSEHVLGGGAIVHSLALINSAEGDQLWLSVTRGNKHTIEFMQFNEVLAMPHHLDSAVYSETEGTSLSGLEHLEGETVRVAYDLGEEDVAVSSGAVRIAHSQAIAAGYANESRLDFLPPPPVYGNLRNAAGKAKITEIEIDAGTSSDFALEWHGEETTTMSVASSIHAGGIGSVSFDKGLTKWVGVNSGYAERPYMAVASRSSRPFEVHRVSYGLDIQ